MTTGYLMLAYNNQQIDYVRIALINALMIKKNHPGVPVGLITNNADRHIRTKYHPDIIAYAFDHIIESNPPKGSNPRTYQGGQPHDPVEFINSNRGSCFDLTPFDETILVDADYLIMDDSLESCWGSQNDLLINKSIKFINHKDGVHDDARLDPMGIPLYWATVVYFNRSESNRMLFWLIEYIRNNYEYYRGLYGFSGRFYRNDFAFSIAIHILSGSIEGNHFVGDLPVPFIYTCSPTDWLLQVEENAFTFSTYLPSEIKPIPAKISNMSIHVMNKYAISAHSDRLLSLYAPEGMLIYV